MQINKNMRNIIFDSFSDNKESMKCLCCGIYDISEPTCHLGHIESKLKKGFTDKSNLIPICQSCNIGMEETNMIDYILQNELDINDELFQCINKDNVDDISEEVKNKLLVIISKKYIDAEFTEQKKNNKTIKLNDEEHQKNIKTEEKENEKDENTEIAQYQIINNIEYIDLVTLNESKNEITINKYFLKNLSYKDDFLLFDYYEIFENINGVSHEIGETELNDSNDHCIYLENNVNFFSLHVVLGNYEAINHFEEINVYYAKKTFFSNELNTVRIFFINIEYEEKFDNAFNALITTSHLLSNKK